MVPYLSRSLAKSGHIDKNMAYFETVINFDPLRGMERKTHSFKDLEPLSNSKYKIIKNWTF